MGKASSSKKVARAARAAGRPGTRRGFLWPAAIGAVVVLGVLLIVDSRGANEDAKPPLIGDHWHAAYGIYDCDQFIPPLTDVVEDRSGIHSHGDGLIHMHPFGTSYTGDGATINAFGETTGLVVTDDSISARGIERENGDECGDEPGSVKVMVWESPDAEEGRLIEEDLGDYAPQEFEVITIAFVAEGTEIPKPPPEVLQALRAPADLPGNAPPSTIPALDPTDPTETSVLPGEETTVPADDPSSTTAPPTETTTTATSSP